ncbi:zinc finger protein [Cricetulus griseus]|uniref:Zinc finger protein n=1 Tax=Cricetulus griseus TaxID=10029 RepID=A0A061IBZ5_CRIGR|nr:zinc finger protein [Cricetulus griseus]
MEVDTQDSPVSISPSRNIGYSTLMGREKIEPLQKLPEGRVPPERNLFSQDISVKMASELLFQLSEKVSKEHNHTKENTIRTTTRTLSVCSKSQNNLPFVSDMVPFHHDAQV